MSPLVYVREKYLKNDEFKTLLFWHGPLSQWWYSPFIIEGEEYICAEQYMMAQKARLFGDIDVAAQIMACKGEFINQKDFNQYPREHQKLGRKVRGYDDAAWNVVARDTVLSVDRFI